MPTIPLPAAARADIDVPVAAATPEPSAVWPDCADCAAARRGPFCSACGQGVADEGPISLVGMARTFGKRVTGLDRGLLFTLVTLYRRGPGVVARRYIDGERRRLTHPLLMVVLAAAFVLFTFRFYEASYVDLMEATFAESFEGMDAEARAALAELGTPRAMAEGAVGLMKANMTLLVLLSAFPMGVLMWFFFRGGGTSLAEWTVLGLYITAGVNFVTALYNVWFFGTAEGAMNMVGLIPILAVYSAFVMWGVKTFGRRSWGDAFVGLLAYLLSYGVAMVGGVVLGSVAALVAILWG